MSEFEITGQHPISGTIEPQGNKNEALPVLCAALLNPNGVTLENVPAIEDIFNLIKILEHLGVEIESQQHDISLTLHIKAEKLKSGELPAELSSAIRGSITLMAPLLVRTGEMFLPRPGGDKIGRRRVDTHLLALGALGADIKISSSGYHLRAARLKGTEILLDEASVTGTENAVMAAAFAEGETVIENAASEPHVQGLCHFLVSQGVDIRGIGSNILTIQGMKGVNNLKSVTHRIGPDYLEIGSFVSIAALTGGDLRIKNVIRRDLRMINAIFARLGIDLNYDDTSEGTDLLVPPGQNLEVITDAHGEIPKIDDAPWPAYPADMISIALVAATQCRGTVLIHEKLFESRLFFVDKLISMGARIVLCDPHRAVVIGKSPLFAARLSSPDIRAGMALVIAALAAEGTSYIQNINQVDRGYARIDERLQRLGAKIKRI